MFRAQPLPPRFRPGQLVHLTKLPHEACTDPAFKQALDLAARESSEENHAIVRAAFSSSNRSLRQVQSISLDDWYRGMNGALNTSVDSGTIWKIESVEQSTTTREEHSYTLSPIKKFTIHVVQSGLMKADFVEGDVVIQKADRKDKPTLLMIKRILVDGQRVRVQTLNRDRVYEWFWSDELMQVMVAPS